MVPFADLWLPIVLSGVGVFVASSLIHMVIRWHMGDYRKLPGEDQLLDVLRAQNVSPGGYMFPCPESMKNMCTPEMQAKFVRGPVGNMTVMKPGPMSMGKPLAQWFVLCLAVSAVVGHLAGTCLAPGANLKLVFHTTFLAAFLGYSINCVTDSIWKGVSWGISVKFVIDGIIYALVTAGVFMWMWPAA